MSSHDSFHKDNSKILVPNTNSLIADGGQINLLARTAAIIFNRLQFFARTAAIIFNVRSFKEIGAFACLDIGLFPWSVQKEN